MATSSESTHSCICSFDGCSASFVKLSELEKHQRIHTGERPFACTIEGCQKRYICQYNLKRHMSEDHCTQPQKSRCPVAGCNQLVFRNRSLETHLENVHFKKGQYMCKICGKNFHKRKQLSAHLYIHTGAKKFKCLHPGCDKEYQWPGGLKRHSKVHNGYKCDFSGCDVVCETWNKLRTHKDQNHKDIRCPVCKKAFTTYRGLKNHKHMHSDIRDAIPCTFPECRRYFFYRGNLLHHIRTFHEGKRYCCAICDKEFLYNRSLIKHLVIHDPGYEPPKKPCGGNWPMAEKLSFGHRLKKLPKKSGKPSSTVTNATMVLTSSSPISVDSTESPTLEVENIDEEKKQSKTGKPSSSTVTSATTVLRSSLPISVDSTESSNLEVQNIDESVCVNTLTNLICELKSSSVEI